MSLAEHQLSESLLGKPYEALTPIQKSVIDLVAAESPSKEHPALGPDDRTFLERLADQVAAIGGSWGFIFGFFVVPVSGVGLSDPPVAGTPPQVSVEVDTTPPAVTLLGPPLTVLKPATGIRPTASRSAKP